MFRNDRSLAWTYHRNTCRWPFNMHGVNPARPHDPAFKEHLDLPLEDLPAASWPPAPLEDLISTRHSCRRFENQPITRLQLATLFRTAYGVLGESDGFGGFLERPVPSGGALYPLELYALVQHVADTPAGVLHYLPLTHAVEIIHEEKLPRRLSSELFLGQPYLMNAAAIIVIVAIPDRSLWKYEDRGYRYLLLEAGHVGQNIILTAGSLGLGALPLGGFFDDDLAALLRLNCNAELPLYAIATGIPAAAGRDERRTPREGDARFRRY